MNYANTVQVAAYLALCLQSSPKTEAFLDLHSNKGSKVDVTPGCGRGYQPGKNISSLYDTTKGQFQKKQMTDFSGSCRVYERDYCWKTLLKWIFPNNGTFINADGVGDANILSWESPTNGPNPAEGKTEGTCQCGTANLWPSVTERWPTAETLSQHLLIPAPELKTERKDRKKKKKDNSWLKHTKHGRKSPEKERDVQSPASSQLLP